jgi:hypothetical protein
VADDREVVHLGDGPGRLFQRGLKPVRHARIQDKAAAGADDMMMMLAADLLR